MSETKSTASQSHSLDSNKQRDGEIVLSSQKLAKSYHQGHLHVDVLRDVNVEIGRGETVAIIGASGSGKSTLLNLLGGLDEPSSGSVQLDGQDMFALNDNQRGLLRNRSMGFVYQFHHLLPEFTALENVAMPLLIGGVDSKLAKKSAANMLEKVGLGQRLEHKPSELSGGERQRVAIARAIVSEPACVLMDEPTGNLDRNTAESIHQLMVELNQQSKTSFVVVTHDENLAQKMGRVLSLSDGTLVPYTN